MGQTEAESNGEQTRRGINVVKGRGGNGKARNEYDEKYRERVEKEIG